MHWASRCFGRGNCTRMPCTVSSAFNALTSAASSSCIVSAGSVCLNEEDAALPGFGIGTRFHSSPVVRLADAKPLALGHLIKVDARWRRFAFCPDEDPSASNSAIRRLCDFLATSPASPILAYTRPDEDIDAVIDLRVILQQQSRDLSLERPAGLPFPAQGRYGLIDYEKVFCAVSVQGRHIFDMRGIDRKKGCLVIVRPDQHVAHVVPFEAHAAQAQFFDCFMVCRASPLDDQPARGHAGIRQ